MKGCRISRSLALASGCKAQDNCVADSFLQNFKATFFDDVWFSLFCITLLYGSFIICFCFQQPKVINDINDE